MIGRGLRRAAFLALAGVLGLGVWPILTTGLGAAGLSDAAPFGWLGLAVRLAWTAGVAVFAAGAWPALTRGADPSGRVKRFTPLAFACLGLAGLGAVVATGQPLRLWFLFVHAEPGAAVFRAGVCWAVGLAAAIAGWGFPDGPKPWRRVGLGVAVAAAVAAWAVGQGMLGAPDNIFLPGEGFLIRWP